MPELDLSELKPLATIIAGVITETPVRIGQRPDDLVARITLAVAVYMGKQVHGLPEELAELQQLRRALADRPDDPQYAELRDLIGDLAEDSLCRLDHHGYCQEHGWFATEPKCPIARARDLGLIIEDDDE